MQVYDAHMHIHNLAKTPNPDKLIEKMHEAGFYGGALFSEHPFFEEDFNKRMDNLFAWVKGYEGRLFPVAWMHPHEKDIFAKLKEAVERGVLAFKFICEDYYPYEELPMKVFEYIGELGKPIFFHCGILYDFLCSSDYNRPTNWECFVNSKNIKFSLGHCGFPWHEDAIWVYNKYNWIYEQRANPDLLSDDISVDESSLLYLDTTRGAPPEYREELLSKINLFNPNSDRVFFGTDSISWRYDPKLTKKLLDYENKTYDKLGVSEEIRQKIYRDNLFEFLNIK